MAGVSEVNAEALANTGSTRYSTVLMTRTLLGCNTIMTRMAVVCTSVVLKLILIIGVMGLLRLLSEDFMMTTRALR